MSDKQIVIPKVWQSEVPRLIIFFIACALSIFLSRLFPHSVIRGELFSFGERTVILDLPLYWLVPASLFIELLFRIYNVRYAIDPRFIEARVGILSLNQNIVRVRFEDIRGVETDQTLLGRALDFGDVQIGTAATAEMEVILRGIGAPREVREMIEHERDVRIALARKAAAGDESRMAAEA